MWPILSWASGSVSGAFVRRTMESNSRPRAARSFRSPPESKGKALQTTHGLPAGSPMRPLFRQARVQRFDLTGLERVFVTVRGAPVFAFDLGIGGEINLELVGLPVLKKREVGELHLAPLAFDAIVDGHHGVSFQAAGLVVHLGQNQRIPRVVAIGWCGANVPQPIQLMIDAVPEHPVVGGGGIKERAIVVTPGLDF